MMFWSIYDVIFENRRKLSYSCDDDYEDDDCETQMICYYSYRVLFRCNFYKQKIFYFDDEAEVRR